MSTSSMLDLAAVRERLKRAKNGDTPQAVVASWADVEALCVEVEQRRAQFERGRTAAVALAKDAEAVCADNDRLTAENARLAAESDRLSRWLDRNITPEDATRYALGILAANALDAPNCAEFGGTIEQSDGTKRAAVVSVQWVDGKAPHVLIAERTAERDAARGERDALRAIIAGRDRPPTIKEARAHSHGTRGAFIVRLGDDPAHLSVRVATGLQRFPDAHQRWWALDASGAPCAWPAPPIGNAP